MNYEDLRKFQRMERNSSSLAELPVHFYSELSELIKSYKDKYAETGSVEDAKVLDNIQKIAVDIFERREMKILTKALKSARSGFKEDKVVEIETSFFDDGVKLIKNFREEFDKALIGEFSSVSSAERVLDEKVPSITNEEGEAEDLNMVVVRILQNVPAFVSSNGDSLGPFESNEVVRLPSSEANLLVEKGFAELVWRNFFI